MSTFATPDATVLVADDEPELADLHSAYLQDEYDVRTVYGGDAAMEALDASVDVVLLDREMPDRSGVAVLDALEGRERAPHVALVTAVTPDFDVVDMPIDDYLQKPVGPVAVQETVERLLETGGGPRRELHALQAKRELLEAEKHEVELQRSDAYRRLVADIERLESTVATTAGPGRRVPNEF